MSNFFKKFWIFGVILIINLLVFHIFQMNKIVSEIYSIKNYEIELSKISRNNRMLEITYFQKNSFENAKNLVKELNFEKPIKTSYIRVLKSPIVTK